MPGYTVYVVFVEEGPDEFERLAQHTADLPHQIGKSDLSYDEAVEFVARVRDEHPASGLGTY